MRVGPIKQRLKDEVTAFKTVAGAAALAAALQNGQFSHSAYVFVSKVGAGDNQLANRVSQLVPVEVTAAYWVRNVSDATGEAAQEEIEDLRESVIAALLGWSPAGIASPFLYRGGEVIDFRFGTVLWADKFVINTYLRSA